jgi:hypothetical protein
MQESTSPSSGCNLMLIDPTHFGYFSHSRFSNFKLPLSRVDQQQNQQLDQNFRLCS